MERFLQEASNTPLLLPRLEVREPLAGATCSKTLLTTWSWPNIHKEIAVITQSPFFFYSAIENLVPAWRPGIPPPILPGTQGWVCEPEPQASELPGSQPQCTHRGRPGGPHHLEAPGANCEGLKEQRARTHPSS